MGRYRIECQLPEARRGELYRARDEGRGGAVLVRLLRAVEPPGEVPEHPRIGRVLESGRLRSGGYLVVEPLGPATLDRGGAVDPVAAMAEVLEAVTAAQARGVLHRHLCPKNVHLVPGRGCVVADYGVPWLGLDGSFRISVEPFLAPEVRRCPWTAPGSAEVWSAGAIGWYLLTGAAPPDDAAAAPIGAPDDLAALLRSMLAADPRRRPSSRAAFEAAAALRPAAARVTG